MIKAVIFDMDGVLVDNHNFHVEAWKKFCREISVEIDIAEFRRKYFGKGNRDILSGLLNREVTDEEVHLLGERKEEVYREVYSEFVEPVYGLVDFLEFAKSAGIKLAVATSAPVSNLDFIIDKLSIRNYFDCLTNGNEVAKAKPHPEVYLITARKLNLQPDECVVFEDSVSGIESAKNAGMKVIGLLTTHSQDELPETEFFIPNFADIKLESFFEQNGF
ncbi:MAG TPA: HAD family phosphatase [Tenuifilaceae bacterium]|nr:HAD family phosphatase [Tenuifilaceae bacterium]HPE17940.1 HAD family phosphatase [Tenuifilaceae bacterium]HPJ45387.1 HAD family phosphatase [Tenuifilaceae bacterium]HPQ33232.1 HAD family phosphatase [Tenuifilaceae bacterium]